MITYRIFRPADRDRLLDLICRSDNTDRTVTTWEANPMTAALAFDGNELIGAVPLERRNLRVGHGHTIPLLWVTAAHVERQYRSHGVGSALLDCAAKHIDGFEGFGVYREDEMSPAYRWYAKAGFRQLLPIRAYRKPLKAEIRMVETFTVVSGPQEVAALESDLLHCHARCVGTDGGFPVRQKGYWRRLFEAHYYRDFNIYSLLLQREGDAVKRFAVLGRTNMRDGVDRFDILEFVAESGAESDRLQAAIETHAVREGVREVRIQLGANEPMRAWAEARGYEYRNRGTFILGQLFRRKAFLERRRLESQTQDSVLIEIESAGRIRLSSKEPDAMCSMDDAAFDELAFQRKRPADLLREGSLVCGRDPNRCMRLLETMFPAAQWRYFQADYI